MVAVYLISGFSWYSLFWLVLLVGLALVTDVRVRATDVGLRRLRPWGASTIEWSDVEAVECLIKKPGASGYVEMLTVDVWRRSRAQPIPSLTTPETWSVALISRERARRQAADLAEAVAARGIPSRVRDWPAVEDEQAVPVRWW
jgi:hypothetical protein